MTAGRRSRVAALLRWLVPIVGLALLQRVAIGAVRSTSDRPESDRWYPRAVGTTWIYASRSNGQDSGTHGIEQQEVTTTLDAREDEVVAGALQRGCEHYRSATTVHKNTGDVERTYEVWLCPELGPVRTVESDPDFGALLEEELTGFRSPGRRLGTLLPPSPAPGAEHQ